jgi:hypothetical protein
LIPLPPRAPELNPQENIWQFMRANSLSNRVFKSYDDIVDHCCYAWNTLVDQPWKIMSIARRDWAAKAAQNYRVTSQASLIYLDPSLVRSGRRSRYPPVAVLARTPST